MLCMLPHIVVARHCLLSCLQLHKNWQTINIVIATAGAATAVGVGALGFFPWDKLLFEHLARRFASASCGNYAAQTWDSCRRRRRFQLPVAVACICVLIFALVCFAGAYFSDPDIFTKDGLKQTLELANSNFDGYCT